MTEVVLGIDVGTSGVRIAARNREGGLCGMSVATMPATETGKQDAQQWWRAVVAAMHGLDLAQLRVMAIAIDGTSGSIVPVDAEGTPLGLASMYNAVAETEHVACIKRVAPPETAAHGSTSPLARAMGMGGARFLHQADWLAGKFSGSFDVSDENNALKTGYDPVARKWPDWIEAAGFDAARLPRVVAAGARTGTILAHAASRFGLRNDVAIVAGTTDGCAGFLASGAHETGEGVTSLGTTLTLKLLSATPVFAPQYGIYSHRIGGQWLAGGASNSGGVVLKKFFPNDEIVRLTALMDAEKPTGLDYYPLPKAGERFPISDPALVPRMSPRPPEDHLFLQGLFEGMAGIEALGYQRLAELGATPLKCIRSTGGGAVSGVWSAIRLKKLGVPALPSASDHAAMGVARLAWRGIGHDA